MKTVVPPGMRVQFGRLFGERSSEARRVSRTPEQWKASLRGVVGELERYLERNIRTDGLHWELVQITVDAAKAALDEDDFWPAYAEAMTRLVFLLIGDYPDHRDRRGGRKPKSFYKLNLQRSVVYAQSDEQRISALFGAKTLGVDFQVPPRDALRQFRRLAGYAASLNQFFAWYRSEHPTDYTKIF